MNKPCLQPTIFIDVDNRGKEYDRTYGYRLYDDYESVYNNTFDSMEAVLEEITLISVIGYVRENHQSFIQDSNFTGIYLDSDWVPYSKED